jgi:putative transposase
MPRVARIVIPDVPHHVIQRGNNRQDVFFVNEDRRVYLRLLREQVERFRLDVIGYSLMTNHVHLVVLPHAADSLAKAVGRTDFLYTQHVNSLHGRSGHLWQNRFTSCALDEKHTVAALRYAEQNPVRANLAKHAWDYEWSSARAHVTGKDPTGLLDMTAWLREWDPKDWRETLRSEMDPGSVSAVRFSTARGRPLGSDSFLSKMESLLGKRVRPYPIGRPQGWRKRKGGRTK